MWGWTISKSLAFELLDCFTSRGFCIVDSATNYPIDSDPSHFGLALSWIEEWLAVNREKRVKVLVKVGSTSNDGSDTSQLSKRDILNIHRDLVSRFGSNLYGISIHWDNAEDSILGRALVADTIDAFRHIFKSGYKIGLSGIKNPSLYAELAPDLAPHWVIQVKETAFSELGRSHYFPYFEGNYFLAYGINFGGIKLGTNSPETSLAVRKIRTDHEAIRAQLNDLMLAKRNSRYAPANLNELALNILLSERDLGGIIIGPSSIDQLESTLNYVQLLVSEK